jgi:hypothetical protein
MMKKRVQNIVATLEATDTEFWVVCKVGRKTYKAHWKRSSPGSVQQESGYDTLDINADNYVKEILNALESGAWDLMNSCEVIE